MQSHSAALLNPDTSLVLVVDIQEKFAPVIPDYVTLIARTGTLIQAAQLLDVPVVVSEQYTKGLGPLVAALRALLPDSADVLEKSDFGCGRDEAILNCLQSYGRRQIVVCGIEAHICVNQTVHQLLAEGFQVHIVQDAIASRREADRQTALAKMQQSGAVPSCVEMTLFEWLGTARHPAFKQVQALVK